MDPTLCLKDSYFYNITIPYPQTKRMAVGSRRSVWRIWSMKKFRQSEKTENRMGDPLYRVFPSDQSHGGG